MDISKKSIEELKAMAFDEMTKRDIANQNLQILMNELEKRQQTKPASKK